MKRIKYYIILAVIILIIIYIIIGSTCGFGFQCARALYIRSDKRLYGMPYNRVGLLDQDFVVTFQYQREVITIMMGKHDIQFDAIIVGHIDGGIREFPSLV